MNRLVLLVAMLLAGPALADDPHHGGDDLLVNTNMATSLVGGDSRTIALSQGSLGDVDIYGCLGSSQFSVFIFFAKQKLEIDPLCVADGYDKAGKHNLAAQLRCQVPLVAGLNYTGTDCITANTFEIDQLPPPPDPVATAAAAAHQDTDDDLIRDTAAQLAQLQADLNRERNARRQYARQQNEQAALEAQYQQEFLQQYKEAAGVVDEN